MESEKIQKYKSRIKSYRKLEKITENVLDKILKKPIGFIVLGIPYAFAGSYFDSQAKKFEKKIKDTNY